MKNALNPKDCQELIDRIDKLSLAASPQWGKMKAHDVCPHLNLQVACALGDLPTKDKSKWYSRTLVKWYALWVMKEMPKGKIKAPKGVDPERIAAKAEDFEKGKEELKSNLLRMRKLPDNHPKIAHPMLGMFNKNEWGRLTYQHTDHHLRQFGA